MMPTERQGEPFLPTPNGEEANLVIRNLSYFLGTSSQGLPTGASLGASFLLRNCYGVIIENGFWLLDVAGVPFVVDCDPYTFDVLLKDNYVIASSPPAVFIRSQNGAARIKERNTTFQSGVTPASLWVNGNSTKNGCIIESWINLFNNSTVATTRCSVDNLGTITFSASQVATTSSSGVFIATFPSQDSINLFDAVGVVVCVNGDNNVNSDLAVPIGGTVTSAGFHAQYVGLTSATAVRLNFTATGI
jgi:hypothetical protein